MNLTYGLILIAAITSALPITLVKQYNSTNEMKWLFFAIISYLILILCYIRLLKTDSNIATLYPFIKIISIFVVLFIAVYYYGEKLEWKHIIGVLLGAIGIYLLS